MTAEDPPEDRIEAALERIAKSVEADDPAKAEIAQRLDRIIASLREALGK